MKKFIAFTLAETLVVIGIIGVVAALTLPNLNSSTGNKEKIAKVKKVHSALDDAFGRALTTYGPLDEWYPEGSTTQNISNIVGSRMVDYLKVLKNCGLSSTGNCFTSINYKYSSGNSSGFNFNTDVETYKFILNDGTTIGIKYNTPEYISAFVDIDGPKKGTAVYGEDLFFFNITGEGVETYRPTSFASHFSGVRLYASSWIVDYDNMDYLKADSSGKCPNGTTLTQQNPRCK